MLVIEKARLGQNKGADACSRESRPAFGLLAQHGRGICDVAAAQCELKYRACVDFSMPDFTVAIEEMS